MIESVEFRWVRKEQGIEGHGVKLQWRPVLLYVGTGGVPWRDIPILSEAEAAEADKGVSQHMHLPG